MEREALLKQLGKAIQNARKGSGLSQEEFANQLGIDRSYYGRIEQGRINLSFIKLYRLSNALGLNISVLLQDIGQNIPKQFTNIYVQYHYINLYASYGTKRVITITRQVKYWSEICGLNIQIGLLNV